MKDQEARKRIDRLMERFEVRPLAGVVVAYCPECKHKTLQQREVIMNWFSSAYSENNRQCLICGNDLVCKTKTTSTCRVIKNKKEEK